jgi:NAD(P)-dependent dehydrogenase (short-subunit alcohol dehydrogenase family)
MVCGSCTLTWIGLVLAGLLAILKVYAKLTVGRCTSKRNLTGKVAIVTGANVGIGLETVKELLMRNARVIMACRNLDKGQAALETVVRETGCNQVTLKQLDLSSMASVRKFATEILAEESALDILVNNAGAATRTKVMTEDGLETNFAANHFGPFLLTNLLLGLMQKTSSARIVNVSSNAHWFAKELDLDNLKSEKSENQTFTGTEAFKLYSRTKVANILFTRELDRKLKAVGIRNVSVNALHPGAVKTEFNRHSEGIWYWSLFLKFAQLFFKNAEEGAQTTVHVAVAAELDGASGGYYQDCAPAKISALAQDDEVGRKLWDASARLVKLQSEESVVHKKSN